MNGKQNEPNWIRKPQKKGTTVVFVHGFLSSGETCWRHKNGTYWPELLRVKLNPELWNRPKGRKIS